MDASATTGIGAILAAARCATVRPAMSSTAGRRSPTALDHPPAGRRDTVEAAGIPFSAIAWGDPDARPLVLIHGVTASARIWWRVGPALAADRPAGRRRRPAGPRPTGHWRGHHRFRDNAADVAAWIRAAGWTEPDLQIVGHSWGGDDRRGAAGAGIRPATLVLLDPPAVPLAR